MKKILSILLIIFTSSCIIGSGENSNITANENGYFPFVNGINLNGKKYHLPQDFNNDLNIIAIGFEREHQQIIDTWIPEIDKIINSNQTKKNIKFYELPLIYELKPISRTWINNGMRFGIPNEIARARTITVYTNRNKFLEIMKMQSDKVYIIVLDKRGKIIWQDQDEMKKNKIENLKKILLNN